MSDTRGNRLQSLWDEARAAGMSEAEKLLYRSNLLGSDKRITNFGGGNTSAKVEERDPLTGEAVTVLWVKGSGGDIGTMTLDGFATLYQDKLERLRALYRGPEHEDAVVDLYNHCTFNLNPRATSIDTPLHAFLPYRHVDHMHPDAVIAIAATARSRALTQAVYGTEVGWLPWRRPGFQLGLDLADFAARNPQAKGVVLESHGLFTWGDTAEECYETTLRIINTAIGWFEHQLAGKPAFGGEKRPARPAGERARVAAELMPAIRAQIGSQEHKVGHFDDSAAVLDFVGSERLEELAALGTSCPDHFLRTKIRPLVLSPDGDIAAGLATAIESYRDAYAAYYERCRHPDSPAMRDPNPVIYLVPGVGLIAFAKDKATARIASEFYINAINVMRGASGVDTYRGLPEQEAFNIEYWLLEEAKLQRMPARKSLAGRIAFITGGAGGIGRACAERLAGEGACVVLADIDAAAVDAAVDALATRFGADQVQGVVCDVTAEEAVAEAFRTTARAYGGLDILVSNAGIASAARVEDTTLAVWNRNIDILATGYFLVSREAFRLFRRQALGGAVVFVASKNGLAASPGASAYCTAKAAEIHLARCLALEGADAGIRVNTVNPDAVLRGSKIWSGEWREQRAASSRIGEDELEEHYRMRSLLKRSVFPEDIAEAVYFLSSDRAAKSTGNIVNVDAGNQISFTR